MMERVWRFTHGSILPVSEYLNAPQPQVRGCHGRTAVRPFRTGKMRNRCDWLAGCPDLPLPLQQNASTRRTTKGSG